MKSLYDLACDYNCKLYVRLQARYDDLNRKLTDKEVMEECIYQLETVDYSGWGDDDDYPEEVREKREFKRACRHVLKIGENRARKFAEAAA